MVEVDVMDETKHVPVLLGETIQGLKLEKGDVVVDATLGGGGHAGAILDRILPGGMLIAFDVDEQAIERFERRIRKNVLWKEAFELGKIMLIRRNFSELDEALSELCIESVSAILADLGFSSDQMEDANRGFSFRDDGPLDMRLDRRERVTAAMIVNEWSESSIRSALEVYADERFAKRIARAIVERRSKQYFRNTADLAETIADVVPQRSGGSHPATKTFQAIRMAVNSEYDVLERFLNGAIGRLEQGGRLAIISFHSGEDRKVKQKFREDAGGCICPKDFPVCRCGKMPLLKLITTRPIVPSREECAKNPRARSARLRITEKL